MQFSTTSVNYILYDKYRSEIHEKKWDSPDMLKTVEKVKNKKRGYLQALKLFGVSEEICQLR